MRDDLPTGTVTFLFTDVEGSTSLLHELGVAAYADALAEHRGVIRKACAAEGGVEVDTQGDAFFFAFPTAPGALAAASALTEALAPGPIKVRAGLHTGTPLLTDGGYVGDDVHRAARIAAAAHGGQVLISTSTAGLVEFDLADLGEHRFKDLAATERVFQLGDGDFGRRRTLYQTNLPIPATSFLGRERELKEVVDLLSRDEVRLLTLTGTGGTGKTRLAVQAAAELGERYEHGIWWVPLASLVDEGLVLEQAGQTLSAKGTLQAHIRDKRMLVIFDNFETVVAAGPDVASLVAACPNLDVLVTSREPLRVAAEQEYPVLPLAAAESIALFLARVRAARPNYETNGHVAEICSRLDHLPLAVELAAARARVLTPKQLLEHLKERLPLLTGGSRDVPERHRTLRATIDWSYDLLADHEQRLFARISVFAGFTLVAAVQVCGTDLDTLQALVEKSLLRQAGGRYWMLETIREFALERLEATEAGDALRDSHAAYFAQLADCRWPELLGAESEWREMVDGERRNLQVALEWSLAREHGEDALADHLRHLAFVD